MAFPRVLFAGDSNLKFVQRFVPERDRDQLKVLSVSGASVVRDVTGFWFYLEEALRNFKPEELYLHLGSNDVSRRTSSKRFSCELRQLIDEVRMIVPDVRVVLCSVLPRSPSAYKDYCWNRFALPDLQRRVTTMNEVLGELCDDMDLDFVMYDLDQHHFGVDGLHVRPAGAKNLLFTILGKVKRKSSAPAETVPCVKTTDRFVDVDDWPTLPSFSPDMEKTEIVSTWGPSDRVDLEKKKTIPVSMPYARVNCDVSFGWDYEVEPVIMPYPKVSCGVTFGWDKLNVEQAECSPIVDCEDPCLDVSKVVRLSDQWKKQDFPMKMYTERELQSNGMMKLDICGVEAYIKPSGFGIKTGLLGGAKNSKQPAEKPGKSKRVNVYAAKEYLKRVCTSSNERNLKPDGPYGDVCSVLSGYSNSKKNRKRLQTLWFRLKKSSIGEEENTDVNTVVVKTKRVTRSKKSVGKLRAKVRETSDEYDIPMKDVDYIAIGRVLRDKINSQNYSCLEELGPYGMICNILGWESSVSNRLFLFTLWKENRGNVRDDIESYNLNFSNTNSEDFCEGKRIFESNRRNVKFEISKNYKFSKKNENIESKEKCKIISGNDEMIENDGIFETVEIRETDKANEKNEISDLDGMESVIQNKIRPTNEIRDTCGRDEMSETDEISEINENDEIDEIFKTSETNTINDVEFNENDEMTENFDQSFKLKENKEIIKTNYMYKNDEYYEIKGQNKNDDSFLFKKTNIGTENNPTINECNITTMEENDESDDSDTATIPYIDEQDCSPMVEFLNVQNYPKHEFDDQYWAKNIEEKKTGEILQMLERFFSDNDSFENSIFFKLLASYISLKNQISRCKKLSEKNNDVEKEYKISEETLMQNILNLDSLHCSSEFKMIKKGLIYIHNCALTRLDHLYKKSLSKYKQAKKFEHGNISIDSSHNSCNAQDPKHNLISNGCNFQDLYSNNVCENKFLNKSDEGPLSKQTISSILEMEIPDEYFTKELSRFATFKITENDMKKLLQNRTERAFKRDSWQSLFFGKVKESNPYCCFQVTSSRLSNATKRKRKAGSPFFLVHAKCTFTDCSIKLLLEMNDKSTVNVEYTGVLKHDIKEVRYRPIKGNDRNQLKTQFKGGLKPMAHYLDKLQQLPTEHLVSGNRDGLGKNSRVFAQIAAESRQGGRMDDSVFQSLQELKEEMNKKVEGGFIQKICASPCYILYWSKFGIDLYNERAKKDALYWDATGSVVRKQEDGKQFLYYELAIRNPIKGKMGVPLTSMITNDQSLSTILDWLRCFRQAEKQKFGHNNKKIVSYPKLIVSDQAMVFILAALKEFNGESLDDFLTRAWFIVYGKADVDDTFKTIVHLCASHFMHSAKLHLKKKDIGGHKLKMFLYIIGLLMNCTSMQDAQELLNDIYMILGSSAIHNENKKFYDRLLRKINDFNSIADNEIVECLDEIEEKSDSINPGRFTEEEFQVLGSSSPFKDWNFKLFSKAQKMISDMSEIPKTDLYVNPLYSTTFSDYLNKRLMPLYPLWGSLLMGDLSRYHENYNPLMRKENDVLFNSINNVGKTNSTIENRFRILKDICLGGRTQHRLDEFSERLKTSTIGIQKLVALDCLKYPSFIKGPAKRQTNPQKRKSVGSCFKKNKKQKTLVQEQWNKGRPQPENLKPNLGKYQQAPQEEIKLKQTPIKRKFPTDHNEDDFVSPIKTRRQNEYTKNGKNNKVQKEDLKTEGESKISLFCGLSNFGNSCWFNSVLQALAHCEMSSAVLESKDLCIDLTGSNASNSEIAIHDIIEVWKYMKDPKFFGTQVPDKILRSAFRSVVAAIPGFSLRQQQDAHEFNSNVIADMSNSLIDNNLEYHFTEECTNCKKARIRETNVGQSIVLNIEGINNVSVQTLISNFFLGDSLFRKCNSCNNDTDHTIKQKIITKFPKTLMVLIRRYNIRYVGKKNIVSKKLHNNIHVSCEISLRDQKNFEVRYQLKSVVCHHGNSTSAGHYSAVIKHNEDYVCCNDTRISIVDSDYTLSTGYLVIYDRIDPSLPLYVTPFINCWRQTRGAIEVLKVMTSNPMIKGKTNLLGDIIENGMTESVIDNIRKGLSLDIVINNCTELDFYRRFIKYLIHTDEASEILFRDNFNVCTNHIRLCQNCGLVDSQPQNLLSLSVKQFSFNSVNNCLKVFQGGRVIRLCRCGSKPDVFIMSLPSTLVINVEDCSSLRYEDIQTLCISNDLMEVYPIGSRKYNLKSIYGHSDGIFLSSIKTVPCLIPTLNDKEINSFEKFNSLVLFFDRDNFTYDHDNEVINMLNKIEVFDHPILKTPKQKPIGTNFQKETLLFGIKLCKDFFTRLSDISSWLSSDHVNVYFSLLARVAGENLFNVHPVNSVWYSQRLVKDSDPKRLQWVFHETESKVKWLDYNDVLIPINENGSHWTLVVIKIKEKQIIYCNSLPLHENSNIICHQVWRYLCYEAFLHSGIILQKDEWSILMYHDLPGFPMQTDGSSCGVYICAVAKAIVFKQRLPEEPNLLTFRKCMINEINNSSLYL